MVADFNSVHFLPINDKENDNIAFLSSVVDRD
jgi:hypothetical protein